MLCNFLVRTLQCFFLKLTFFLPLKTLKKHPQKLLIIDPIFFFDTGPAAQTDHKRKSRTTKSPLLQDWVFRLGVHLILSSRMSRN